MMITEIRKAKGLSITKLAAISGVHRVTISRIEHGRTKTVKLQTLEAIAKALECSISDLL